MPAILRTDEEVAQWLNFETVSTEKALGLIQPMGELVWHPVTRAMGNTSYKNVDASKPIK
jgi:putative SOS response-associated peptidase YedK